MMNDHLKNAIKKEVDLWRHKTTNNVIDTAINQIHCTTNVALMIINFTMMKKTLIQIKQ